MHHRGYNEVRRLAGLISLLLVVGVVGFVGGAGSTAFAAVTQTVTIGTTLSPKQVTVAPGTTVTWKALGGKHRIESTSGPAELKSDDLTQGNSWSFTFTEVGMYSYVDQKDKENPAFHGIVTVSKGAPPPTGNPPPAAPVPTTAAVSLAGKAFSPASVTVAVGGTVTWTNNDSMDHNVTANAGEFTSPNLAPGGKFSFKFTKPGTYAYNCTYHGGMNGTVIVPTASGNVPPPVVPAPPKAGPRVPAPPAVPAAPGKPGKHTVMVSDTGFTPANLAARAGDTVTWVNNGQAPHTATAAGGAFDLTLAPGASASTVLQKPGTIQYVCTYHSNMTGSIVIGAAPPGVVVGPAPANAGSPGSAGGASPAPAPAAVAAEPGKPGKHTVMVSDTGFTPANLAARAGDTVTWVNNGQAPHTATAAGGAFDLTLAPGASASTVLQKPGTIQYVCTYHPYMTGSIVIGAALPGVLVAPAPASQAGGAPGVTKPAAAAPVSTGKAKTIEIKVNEMTFAPAMANANVGDTISWVNVGKIPHTVTAKDGSFDKTPLAPGQRFNYVLRKEGSVSYVCTYHPGMDGMLMVGPALAGVAVPAAADDSTKPDSAAPASSGLAETHEIKVKDSSFTPATLAARVGDTISWVNLGKIPHTVTAKDKSFNKTLKPGQRFNLVLRAQGTINYVCTPHPGMFGVLEVGPALTDARPIEAPPMTLASMSPVAVGGLGTGWVLVIGLLATSQLRSRIAAKAIRAALRRRAAGDLS